MSTLRSAFILSLAFSVALGSVASAQTGRARRGSLSSRGTSLRALPSLSALTPRSAAPTIETQMVMGRVGVVRVPSVTLRAGRNPNDKALAVVSDGTNLAVLMEKEGYYGVLMQDSTMGWVMTGAVEMLDYRVQVKLSKAVPAPEPDEVPESPVETPTQPTPDASVTDPRSAALIREAFTYIGVPYVWAGTTRRGLDCSAFLKNVFAASRGLGLPRVSADQARVGLPVASTEDLVPGDRLYFDMGHKGRVSHCGLYLGNGYFIHASSNRHCVGVDKLASGNYWSCLVAARHDP